MTPEKIDVLTDTLKECRKQARRELREAFLTMLRLDLRITDGRISALGEVHKENPELSLLLQVVLRANLEGYAAGLALSILLIDRSVPEDGGDV